MNISIFRAFLFVSALIIFPICSEQSYASDPELEMLKKQMEQMEKSMEKMNRKILELEEKNKRLEREAEIESSEVIVTEETIEPASLEPAGQTFLGKAFQTFNPEISVTSIFAAAWYSENDPVVPTEIDPQNTGINIQEIELGFQSVVDSYFRFDSFFPISEEGIEIEEAYGTTLLSMPLNSQYRIGKMRAKFGRINQLHRHSQNFVTLPLVAADFLGEHLNPTSIEANFLIPIPWYMELSASVGSPDVETASFARDEDGNNLGRLLYIFHLANFFDVSESLGVSLGGSFATGFNGTQPGNRTNLYGMDFFVKYRPLESSPYQELQLQSEFMYRDAQTEEGDQGDWGLYAQAIYRFAKRWNAGIRYGITDTDDPLIPEEEPNDAVIVVVANQNGRAEDNDNVLGLFGEEYRVSTMLTFNPTEFSRLRLQYDYLNQNFAQGQHGIFLQFQYAIGSHGSHSY